MIGQSLNLKKKSRIWRFSNYQYLTNHVKTKLYVSMVILTPGKTRQIKNTINMDRFKEKL
jgi:hypothetical protein